MSNSSICLKAINDLLTDEHGQPTQFWIPSYQRGYRWTSLEVTQLLDDVWEFIQEGEGAFYCLQPLVVKARDGGDFEVVDGQQRLTTIYILMTYLRVQATALEKKPFRIHFETRGEANGPFLENIDLSKADNNVDFYHICQAYEAIGNWFSNKDSSIKLTLLQHFLNHDKAGRNVKVIWFQLGSNDNAVSAFTRLNMGKIALTNDELIRALFLKNNNSVGVTESQLRIAYEWDQLEKSLQSDSFWYFLNNEAGQRQNRIGFVFELIVEVDAERSIAKHDAYWIFYKYSTKFRKVGVSPDSEWLRVKQAFMMLEEWYQDRRLYHIVGFLIEQGEKVTDLWELSQGLLKSEFERELRHRIFLKIIGCKYPNEPSELRERVGEALSDLQYGLHSRRIRSTLLLFNIATLLENPRSNIRFQFDSFKREYWDIEHVRSVKSRRPVRHHERVKWFNLCLGILESQENSEELCTEIKKFTSLSQGEASEAEFSFLYERVLKRFQETDGDEADDGISNLTLLDRATNRSYKNSVFAVKRQRLLSLDQSGIFVPLCTRNVFLKCYSQQADNVMFWSKHDRSCYLDAMIETLVNFFFRYTGRELMYGIGDQITLTQLMTRHKGIEIPLIQRDYAQGRLTEEQIREEFLDALQDALGRIPDDDSLPLNLDFIYGSVEEDKDRQFFPLDGQQRLTTLFLLHWYLAWKDDCWDEFRELFSSASDVSRFSYCVRPSSTEFFDELVTYSPDRVPAQVESLRQLIVDQPWYFRNWRLDPTIQSCLNMLDTIHDRFRDSEGLYSRLVDPKQPAITFQLLDLEDFGLSDDLYIKMNARGKPLTAFENFKARYESVLEKLFPDETRTIDGQYLSLAEYFARKMDTKWADFFWARRDVGTNLYDKAVMNLFRTVALVTRDTESSSYLEDVEALRDWLVEPTYSSFDEWQCLDRRFSEILIILLDTWTGKDEDFAAQLPSATYFDEVKMFEKAVTDPTGFSYVEIVQLAAYFVFMYKKTDRSSSDAFQEWMRVIFNLSVNTSYDRASDMQRSIAGINQLVAHSEDILKHFATVEKPVTGFSEQQIMEEKLKAQLIIGNANWRRKIDRAESHKYFRGQIEFLLEFCGALNRWRETGCVEWEIDEHLSLQGRFQGYLSKAELMFNARGLVDLGMSRWERALLVLGDYLLPRGTQNHSFLVNRMTDSASWKRLLRGAGARVVVARRLLRELWDDLDVDSDIGSQLDTMIEGVGNLEAWRKAIIVTPKAIKYCESRCIRRVSDDNIYLLKRIQMNGTHAELFTFCLYHNEFLSLASSGDIAPLQLNDYVSVFGTEDEPGIQFEWSHNGHDVVFDFERCTDSFLIFVNSDTLEALPDVKRVLLDVAEFQECEDRLERKILGADSATVVCQIAKVLAEYSGDHAALV